MSNISPGYSTDVVASGVFNSLLRDFRSLEGPDFALGAEMALQRGIQEFRTYEWPRLGVIEPHRFKMWMQLRNLFKRHRFSDDSFSNEELECNTNTSFMDAQLQFATERRRTLRSFVVLQRARSICRGILGEFNMEELSSYVRVGRRAEVGCSLRNAYIDSKLSDPSLFTCPSVLREWFFQNYLPSDPALKPVIKRLFAKSKRSGKPLNLSTDYLNLVNVPKSWKTLRSITPLSTVGLFYSYGIGGVVTEKLRSAGLNINRLQSRHRMLAKRFSMSKKPGLIPVMSHVTADLSRASDSIMSQHLNAVLPRAWYLALRRTFVREIRVPGIGSCYLASVLPMGNGATFPVETLFFYSIIKAVGDLLKVSGTFSVYGDDLIYPRRIHSQVCQVFGDLGIKINEDKTFVDSFFRESCGGDYYRGVDVRPALLPEMSGALKGKRYAAYLYKVLNGLLARWDETEIPSTVNWLLLQLARVQKEILQVPLHYPDTAGLKVRHLRTEWYLPYSFPKAHFSNGTVSLTFRFLSAKKAEGRPIVDEQVFLWDTLRSINHRLPPRWRWWDSWLDGISDANPPIYLEKHRKGWRVLQPTHDEGKLCHKVGLVSSWTQDS